MPDESTTASSWASDYDGAWKELLERYLESILKCFFEHVAASIDWSQAPEFLEQEMRTLLAGEQSVTQRLDQLIKVRMRNGEFRWLLIHLEVQSFQEPDFERRIYRYHQLIEVNYRQDVISLVILADLNSNWRPCEYVAQILGCESRYRFLTCKLLDLLPSLEGDLSIPALAARLQIEGLRTAGEADERYEARLRVMNVLYEHGFSPEDARAIYRTMIRMLKLPEQLYCDSANTW